MPASQQATPRLGVSIVSRLPASSCSGPSASSWSALHTHPHSTHTQRPQHTRHLAQWVLHHPDNQPAKPQLLGANTAATTLRQVINPPGHQLGPLQSTWPFGKQCHAMPRIHCSWSQERESRDDTAPVYMYLGVSTTPWAAAVDLLSTVHCFANCYCFLCKCGVESVELVPTGAS